MSDVEEQQQEQQQVRQGGKKVKGREANPRKWNEEVEEVVQTSGNEEQIINRLNRQSPHGQCAKTGVSAKEAKRREKEGTLGKKTAMWSAKVHEPGH